MIEVQGTPVGKGRPRFTRDGHAFTPDGTRDFEARIKWKAKIGSKEVHDGAVIVIVTSYFVPPKSWPLKKARLAREGRVTMTVKPDVDNLLKAALDGCNGFSFADDKQVVAVVGFKQYDERPRMEIEVLPVTVTDTKIKAGSFSGESLREVLGKILLG